MSFQETAVKNGLEVIAEIISGSDFAYQVHDQIAEIAGTKDCRKVFSDHEHAEEWLNSLAAYP